MSDQKFKKSPPIVFIAGPTATGKTAVGVQVCKILDAEMISADSMQVYRGLDIGTAKATRDEMQGIPCHLIDILEPNEEFNVARFIKLADEEIAKIHENSRRCVIVGGTGLYLKGLLYGLFDAPARDEIIRKVLRDRMTKEGPANLHKELAQIDPITAARVSPSDRNRIERALEVYQTTGIPISEIQSEWTNPKPRYPFKMYVLNLPRCDLYNRINSRVDQMIDKGWIEEVEHLLNRWPTENLHCLKAIGYREIASHLKGDLSKEVMIEEIKKNTRRFAKRQLTWFRKMNGVQWLSMKNHSHEEVAMKIVSNL
jgi:tRNA dimethylallyltransferase